MEVGAVKLSVASANSWVTREEAEAAALFLLRCSPLVGLISILYAFKLLAGLHNDSIIVQYINLITIYLSVLQFVTCTTGWVSVSSQKTYLIKLFFCLTSTCFILSLGAFFGLLFHSK